MSNFGDKLKQKTLRLRHSGTEEMKQRFERAKEEFLAIVDAIEEDKAPTIATYDQLKKIVQSLNTIDTYPRHVSGPLRTIYVQMKRFISDYNGRLTSYKRWGTTAGDSD